MYCPECGVKNENPGASCFVCGHTLPGGGGSTSGRSSPSQSASAGLHPKLDRNPRVRPQRLEAASLGDRVLAVLTDRVLLLVLAAIPFAMTGARSLANLSLASAGTWAMAATGSFLVVFLYHFLLEWGAGTTAGKILFGLRVVNEGEKPNAAAVAIRNALRIVDELALGLPGFLIAFIDPGRRRLGDFVGGTRVVVVPLKTGERVALLITLVVLLAGALFLANYLCSDCPGTVVSLLRAELLNAIGPTVPPV